MPISVLNQFVNFQMLLAISNEPDSVTANLFRMACLAKDDPEGCVRITPNEGMTCKALADLFHCSAESMSCSIELLKKYGIVTEKDGRYFILSLRKKSRKPLSKTTPETLSETSSETIRESHNNNYYNNYLYKNNKKINRHYGATTGPKPDASTVPPEAESGRNCLPFVPDEYPDPDALMPLEKLPAAYRNIVEAWNKLKHKPFTGLYPHIAESVKELLARYSEEAIIETIADIPKSPFLLGNNNTPNRWSISFTWLLKPENFEKLRSGKYHKTEKPAPESCEAAGTGNSVNPLLMEMAQALGAAE